MITVSLLHAESWCAPCRLFKPVFESISKDEKYSMFNFKTYDIDQEEGSQICEQYHVRSVPTTLITDEDGDEIYKIIGNASKSDVTHVLDLVIEKLNEPEEETKKENKE